MAQQAAPLPSTYGGVRQKPLMRRLLGRDWQIAFVFIAPIVILMTVFIAWPFIKAIYTSMTIRNIATRQDIFVGFDNYIRLYSDPFYRQAVRATFIFTAGSITFKLILGMCAALLLHSQKRWRNLLTGLVLLPWIVPSVVQALTWKSIYDPLFGGLNPILMTLGIINQPISWLSDPRYAMASVIAVNVWAGIPFFTVNILAGLSAIDQELYEAAEIDGANGWQRFTQITLPSLRIVIAVATLLSTIWTFNGFETVWLLTAGGPGNLTKVYSILAYQKAISSLQFGPGTAVAFSLTPVLAAFILLLSRYMRRDVSREDMDIVTWQDRVIDGISWVIGTIGSIVAFPFLLVGSAIGRLLPKGKASKKRNALFGNIGRGIGLALLLLFVLFPFYWILITSFKTDLQISQRVGIFWPDPWTTEQFYELFYQQPFFIWFRNSSIVAVTTTALAVVIAALGAYALARLRFAGAQTMQTVLLITYLLPGALMFIPLYGILADLGVINTRWALILTYPTSMIPFATWLLMGYYRAIPEELEHAALVDGATRLQAFLRVTLPLTTPALLAVTLFSFTAAWKEYLFAFVFITSENLMTLPVGLAQTIYGDIYPWGLLMAASLIISIPVVIFYMYGQRFMVAGLTAGSVKG
ncbi:MAG TPA: ABC transporter permease subunit [Caldilineaceae bacterium]|nr:ABC transporter permease subunit [Caldilineaceae bacterium]